MSTAVTLKIIQGDAINPPLPAKSVDLVMGSPPYLDRRTYGDIDARRGIDDWVEWMIKVTVANMNVSRGMVVWVVNGCVKKGRYQPAAEGLVYEMHSLGFVRVEHPLIWHKNAAPNRRDWWCNGYEYVLAFADPEAPRYFDWQAVAKPQRFMNGGAFRQRAVNGTRKIQPNRPRSALARPYDVIRATVGGGQMGHPLAGENEAPYPESLIEQILPALCPVGGTVFDPFGGSGTTGAVANRLGRHAISMDIRDSQCVLTARRASDPRYHYNPSTISADGKNSLISAGVACAEASFAEIAAEESGNVCAPASTNPATFTAGSGAFCTQGEGAQSNASH